MGGRKDGPFSIDLAASHCLLILLRKRRGLRDSKR
jgi:hypothetical protein